MSAEKPTLLVSDPVVQHKKRKNRKRFNKNVSRKCECRAGVRRWERKRRANMFKEFFSTWVNDPELPSTSCSDDPPVIDLTLLDEDTVELPSCPSSIEFLI